MSVKSFKPKENSNVEAIRYDGTIENAKQIALWVKANTSEGHYYGSQIRERVEHFDLANPALSRMVLPATLDITTSIAHLSIEVGDWLIYKSEVFVVMSDIQFTTKYEEI